MNKRKGMTWIIVLFAINLIATWTIDVSVSSWLRGGMVSSGFWRIMPIQVYHIALWTAVITTLLIVVIIARMLVNKK